MPYIIVLLDYSGTFEIKKYTNDKNKAIEWMNNQIDLIQKTTPGKVTISDKVSVGCNELIGNIIYDVTFYEDDSNYQKSFLLYEIEEL